MPTRIALRTRTVAGSRLISDLPGAVYPAVRKTSIPPVVLWSFVLFVFTIPFEAAQTDFTSGSLSLAKISGLFFILIYFFYYNPLLHRPLPTIPAEMRWFLGYLAIYVLNGLFLGPEYLLRFVSRFLTLLQLIVFFWISGALLQNDKTCKKALVTFTIANAILAGCTLLQLPGFYGTLEEHLGERVTTLGTNPNTVGELMAIALVALIGLLLSRSFGRFKNALLILAAVPVLVLLVETGSRSSIGGFALGSSAYQLLFWHSKKKFWAILLSILALVSVIYVTLRDPSTLERFEATYEEGNVAGRDIIYSAAAEMFLERPIFGWHPIALWRELGLRVGEPERDAHNLVLHLLLEVGLVGAIPFFIGLLLCLGSAWRASGGALGLTFFALMITILFTNMAGTNLATKPFWFVLAFAVAAAEVVRKQQRRLAVRHPAGALIKKERLSRGTS